MTDTDKQSRPRARLVPWLAVAGAALLAAGTLCPMVVLANGETLLYRDFALDDGNVVLAAAASAFVLAWVFRWYRGLFVAGGVALFMIAATIYKVPRAGFAGATLAWGWLPLVAGAGLLLVAAWVAEKDRPAPQREEPQDEEQPEQGDDDGPDE
jgi:hypothetical protein